jgi:hypothetical protein
MTLPHDHSPLPSNTLNTPLPRTNQKQPAGWWEQLTEVEVLKLARNRLTGTIPPDWERMRRLRVLSLQANAVTDDGERRARVAHQPSAAPHPHLHARTCSPPPHPSPLRPPIREPRPHLPAQEQPASPAPSPRASPPCQT